MAGPSPVNLVDKGDPFHGGRIEAKAFTLSANDPGPRNSLRSNSPIKRMMPTAPTSISPTRHPRWHGGLQGCRTADNGREARCRAGHCPLHRRLLQPAEATLRARLPEPGPVRKPGPNMRGCLSTKAASPNRAMDRSSSAYVFRSTCRKGPRSQRTLYADPARTGPVCKSRERV